MAGVARRCIAGGLSLLLAGGALGLLGPATAQADSAPPDPTNPATPATVTADALPTVQINGVVWSQVVVGNTVYATGKFTRARPAGAAAGTQETVRNHFLAYDIRTGQLIPSFAPDLNGQGLVVTASPDGSRVYVGGDFTRANGQVRNHVAAYSTATGQLIADFRPSVSSSVRAIAATNSTVYLGGNFSAIGSVSRSRLAAVTAANGALLPWAPRLGTGPTTGNRLPVFDAQGNPTRTLDTAANSRTSTEVMALVVTNGGSQVVAAGRFHTINGTAASGVGAIDAVSGASRPFRVGQLVTNQGVNSAVYSLSTDGSVVYGTAYDFYGPGNLEGGFAADADGGTVRWINECKGDTYSSVPMNGALYYATHAHDCARINGFPEQNPRVNKFATAVSLAADGVLGSASHANWRGLPSATLLDWFPTMKAGTYTGQNQAGWSVAANSQYVVYGGEFGAVNGVAQQGLVRYALPTLAPNKVVATPAPSLTATAIAPGTVRIGWKAIVDQDNEWLTYRVYRDGNETTPIGVLTRPSTWWQTPNLAFTDRGVSAGAHTYRVTASDPAGNRRGSAWVTATATAGGGPRAYAETVHADGAIDQWSFAETSGATTFDTAGTSDATINGGVTRGVAGAVSGDGNTAFAFNGGTTGFVATKTAVPAPQTFSVEAWFQTTSTSGGKIVGFGNAATGTSTAYDRHVYMDATGRISFGVYDGAKKTVTTTGAYNDGRWHHVVATLSGQGMALYLDGQLAGRLTTATFAQPLSGYWRIGGDTSWSGAAFFAGRIDEVAVYPKAVSAQQVAAHHALGTTGRAPNTAPTATFTTKVTDLTAAFDGSRSADSDGTVTGYAWDFGDGATGSGATATHAYGAPGTYQVTLRVTDDDGATAQHSAAVTVTAPAPNVAPTAAFTTTAAGRSSAFDASGSTDRDGTVAGYAWDFGDGTTGTGRTATHVYPADGTYTVTLTVTDDDGATGTTQQAVTVAGEPVLASDDFARTVTGGLGTADVGGAWTASAGASRQSVGSGAATFAMTAGANTGSYLGAVSQTGADVRTTVSLSTVPTGGGAMVYVVGRRVDANQEYRARVRVLSDGSVRVGMVRFAGTTAETLIGAEVAVPGLVYTAGTELDVRVQVSGTGTTALTATVWKAGTTEPATPTVSRTDTTASLQAPGSVGLSGYLSGSATAAVRAGFTSFTVSPVA
jgi:PKD repeat protein